MSKIIDSIVQASIDSKNYTGVMLARLEFAGSMGFQRFANTYQSIYWDEGSPTGEVEYVGTGNLASIDVLPETNELGAVVIKLTITGIPNSTISNAFTDEYRNQPVYIWYATLDEQTYAVEGGEIGPVLVFAGLMDYSTIEFGETATISITATSRLVDWERNKGGTFNHSYQQTYVDPTDQGFRSVIALQNKEISWGGYTVADPEYSGAGGSGPGGGGGGKCFKLGTYFRMADGTVKKVENIKEKDEMAVGGRVKFAIRGDGTQETWFNANGIIVSGSHAIKKDNIWMRVRDAGFEQVNTIDTFYTVVNEHHRMVTEDGQIFADYDEVDLEDSGWDDWVIDRLNGRSLKLKV